MKCTRFRLLLLLCIYGTSLAACYVFNTRCKLSPWHLRNGSIEHGQSSRHYRNKTRDSALITNAEGDNKNAAVPIEDRKRKIMFLRTSTGKGTQECYEALSEAKGDLAGALAIINKGINEYVANAEGGSKTQIIDLLHGRVTSVMSPTLALMLELRCETDFVSRNNLFISLTKTFANAMYKIVSDPSFHEKASEAGDYLGKSAMEMKCIRCSKTAKETAMLAKMALNEKIIITRVGLIKAEEDEYLTSYLHGATVASYPLNMVGAATSTLKFKLSSDNEDNKLHKEDIHMNIEDVPFSPDNNCCLEGSECIYSNEVLVQPKPLVEDEQGYKGNAKNFIKQIVQHIVGARPVALSLDDYDQNKISEAREEYEREALASGKGKETVARIVDGRLRKQFGEFVLLEQKWPFDGGKPSVSSAIQDFEKRNKAKLTLTKMMQFSVADDLLVYKPPAGTCYYNINVLF